MTSLSNVFKAYDIRGVVPDELNALQFRAIGVAVARFTGAPTILIARDMRDSGVELAEAFALGARSEGASIIDLGLASPIGTAKQRIHGTPGFIAPEQVQLKPLTPRTDVFCFGATMYKMLTGNSVPSVLRERTKSKPIIATTRKYEEEECPTPRSLNPAIPPALSQLIMDCVRHRVEDRPENLTVVSDRLWLAIGQMERERNPPPTP